MEIISHKNRSQALTSFTGGNWFILLSECEGNVKSKRDTEKVRQTETHRETYRHK